MLSTYVGDISSPHFRIVNLEIPFERMPFVLSILNYISRPLFHYMAVPSCELRCPFDESFF